MLTEKKRTENRKINILFISYIGNYFVDNNASFYRMYQNLIYFHDHDDFFVYVLQPKKERAIENFKLKNRIKSYYFKHYKILNNRLIHFIDFNLFFILKVFKILKKHRIDLIHVDYPYGINILRFFTKKPIIYNAYNVEYIYYSKIGKFYDKIPSRFRSLYSSYIYILERGAVKKCNIINAFSKDDLKIFISFYGIEREKVFINNMGYKMDINKADINKSKARNNLGIDDKKFVVIFHGNYFVNDANKEAINIIKEEIAPNINDKDILFLVAGKMPLFENQENIRFMGYTRDLKSFLYAADIAIIPIFRGSGVRMKMIDYLSAKLPMVTTKQAAHGLFFTDDVHGYIVKNENPIKDMIQKILELKNNSKKIKEFKTNIEILLELKYNWTKILNDLEANYKRILMTAKKIN